MPNYTLQDARALYYEGFGYDINTGRQEAKVYWLDATSWEEFNNDE